MSSNPALTPPVEEEFGGAMFRLRKAMPLPLKKAFRFASALYASTGAHLYDAVRFARYSGAFSKDENVASKTASITKYYHMIEKGLTLPAPRPGFGRQAIQDLCLKVQGAIRAGIVDAEIDHAIDAIAGYEAFNVTHGVDNPPWIGETLALAAQHGIHSSGTPTRIPASPGAASVHDRLDFITSRHSVRHFASTPISDEILTNATRAAQAAPCVCNRQASRVYFARDAETKAKLLACQNGNRGFGDTAGAVALVTVDLRSFLDAGERYQAWIDGGLFAMNLLLGFHAQGYGTCCLNWSAMPKQDKALRKLGIIGDSETVIMMIAVGALREDYRVARSERPAPETVMRLL